MSDSGYTLIYEPNTATKVSVNEFKNLLEKGKDDVKVDTMKKILITILNGDPLPDLLMHIIRFVMPSRNKELKKLLYHYWEVCPKMDESGKMRHEMILVCNAIQRDLQHPNEYIRGNTLRYLTKLKEPELLETLVPNVRQCLEHRHAYVRKNAVFALWSIHKVSDHLAPDADELIYRFLYEENDSVCKRNAFVCLGDLNREAALQYIQDNISVIETLDPLIQLAFIEFIKKDSVQNPSLKQQYAQLMTEIIESSSNVVMYEAANTLTVLTSNPQSILLAGNKFVELATRESDNNVKIITLERINQLHKQHPGVLQDLSLEILRVLSSQDLDVKKKALDVTLQFITTRNVEDVVKLLKKELQSTALSNDDKNADYRQLLINAIHQLAIKFVEVAANVIDLLLDSIADLNTTAAYEVITFVKEVVEKFPDLRDAILRRLILALPHVKSGKVFRGALWVIGEYALEESLIQESWKYIRGSIGEVPIIASELKSKKHEEDTEELQEEEAEYDGKPRRKGPVVLPDGTYATESALTSETTDSLESDSKTPIRKQILGGDFYLGAVLASTLVKLILRLQSLKQTQEKILNGLKAEALLIMVSILRVGESSLVSKKIDEDSADRILSYIKILNDEEDLQEIKTSFLEDTKDAFKAQINNAELKKAEALAKDLHDNAEQIDDAIVFRQLDKDNKKSKTSVDDLAAASGSNELKKEDLSSRLNKIIQLTGFSDPIYAEAFVKVHQYDVVLDVLLVNQTTTTLRNLSVEFATLGDLKVVDKPTTANIGPHGFYKVQTTIKVTSADTGVIFGNIVYDGQHSDDSRIVILNDVHVDIMDYIKPATCSESQFRKMWNEFEWENKITIKSPIETLKEYLDELMKGTNMQCLTPGAVIGEECQFLSANLYSRSSFGEDALANLCIEKQSDGPIIGHVRIRSKGQGLALSLGDRVASISRKGKTATITRV
ncbi:beta-coat protein of the COPI coatomer, putative [Candida dubliniensis CD36]|uniref:Coatomer subunit beta n=1 Tax=Candida dubliniensis (strain CD36 / ATCC MYA-646 / CBS 7987 / NCPF 3949 / NRRL Y-17841) TaxID=573826 RepID=B9WLN9_CANDC|nr:beta-coat protein of the COPI coatomer, putative [Candida dubliniensis CD36]CAX40001.1 beta-coat protein of the COPI coatomer, putative [Candida dubliniensis CD36]